MTASRISIIASLCWMLSFYSSAQSPQLVIPVGHAKGVKFVCYNPKGDLLATFGVDDNEIKIWDVLSGTLVKSLRQHTAQVFTLQFSPSGNYLISTAADSSYCLWDMHAGELLSQQFQKDFLITNAILNATEDKIITFSTNNVISYRDAKSGKTEASASVAFNETFGEDPREVRLTCSKNNRLLVCANNTKTAVFSIDRGLNSQYIIQYGGSVISADENMLLSRADNSNPGVLFVSDIITGKLAHTLKLHHDRIVNIDISVPNNRCVTSSSDGTAVIVDLQTFKVVDSLTTNYSVSNVLDVSPDDSLAATLQHDKVVFWDMAANKQVTDFVIPDKGVRQLKFVTNSIAIVVPAEGAAYALDLRAAKKLYEINGDFSNSIRPLVLDKTRTKMAALSSDGSFGVFNVRTGIYLKHSQLKVHPYTDYKFTEDGNAVLFDELSKRFYLSLNDTSLIKKSVFAFTPSGNRLIVYKDHWKGDSLLLFSAPSLRKLKGIPLPDHYKYGIKNIATSPDNRRMALDPDVSFPGRIDIYDVESLVPLQQLIVPTDCEYFEFNHDGSRMLTTSSSNISQLWDIASGQQIAQLENLSDKGHSKFTGSGNFFIIQKRLYSSFSGKEIFVQKNDLTEHNVNLAVYVNDSTIATLSSFSQKLNLWNAHNGQLKKILDFSNDYPSLFFKNTTGDNFAITDRYGRTVSIVHADYGFPLAELKGVNAKIGSVSYNALRNEFLWFNSKGVLARTFSPGALVNNRAFDLKRPNYAAATLTTAIYSKGGARTILLSSQGVKLCANNPGDSSILIPSPMAVINTPLYAYSEKFDKLAVNFSPDPALLCIDAFSGKIVSINAFPDNRSINRFIAFNPTCADVLSYDYVYATNRAMISVYNSETGSKKWSVIFGEEFNIKQIEYSNDGRTIYVVASNDSLRLTLLEADSGKTIAEAATYENYSPDDSYAIHSLPNGEGIFINTRNRGYYFTRKGDRLVDTTINLPRIFKPKKMLYSPETSRVVGSSSGWAANYLAVWDSAYNPLYRIETPKGMDYKLACNGHCVVYEGYDSTLNVINLADNKNIFSKKFNTWVNLENALLSPDGKFIAVNTSSQSCVRLFNCETNKEIATILYKDVGLTALYKLTSIAWFDSTYSHFCLDDGETGLKVFDLEGRKAKTIYASVLRVTQSKGRAFSLDKENNLFSVISLKDLKTIATFPAAPGIASFDLSDDEQVILAVAGKDIYTYRASNGNLISHIPNAQTPYYALPRIPAGNDFVSGGNEKGIAIYSLETGQPLFLLEQSKNLAYSQIKVSKNYFIYESIYDSIIRIWDKKTGKIVYNRLLPERPLWQQVSERGDTLMYKESDSMIYIYNLKSRKPINRINAGEYSSPRLDQTYHVNNKWIIPCNGKTLILEPSNAYNELAISFPAASHISKYIPNPTNDLLVALNGSSTAWLIDPTKRHPLAFKGSGGTITNSKFSADGSLLFTSGGLNTITAWNVKNHKQLSTTHGVSIRDGLLFAEKDNHVIVQDEEAVNIVNIQTGEVRAKIYSFDSSIVYTLAENFYAISQQGTNHLTFSNGLSTTSLSQFDVRYNRPDKVIESLASVFGLKDQELLNNLHNTYIKRLTHLGLDSIKLNSTKTLPVVTIANQQTVQRQVRDKQIIIRIEANDTLSLIGQIHIWVNGSPVFYNNKEGVTVKPAKHISHALEIVPSVGQNKVEVSVVNIDGIESLRKVFIFHHQPERPVASKLYFIGVGIDSFASGGHQLHWSVKDIRNLAREFRYQDCIVDTLFNSRFTTANFLQLKQKVQQMSVHDKVIVAYSGHGLIDSSFNYYLSTYDVSFENPASRGLAYKEIEDFLKAIPARKKLLLLDACNSGEFDSLEYRSLLKIKDSLLAHKIVAQPDYISVAEKARYGLSAGLELMQNTFIDVGYSTGTNVISAASGTQLAIAKNDIENGIFTHVILDAMKNFRHMTVSQLRAYAKDKVYHLSGGMQTPATRNSENYYDWEIW